MRWAIYALAWSFACACDPGSVMDAAVDGVDGGDSLDGAMALDAGVDADTVPDAAVAVDSGGLVDSGSAGDAGFCACEMFGECLMCSGPPLCEPVTRPNGTACSAGRCLDGVCVAGGVCGDGFREAGPDPAREGCDDGNVDPADACDACVPRVLVVASEAGEEALPGAVSVAEDDLGDLLFVWSQTRGEELYLRGRRYTAAGAPLEAAFDLSGDLGRGWDPHAAIVGLASGWAVVWAARGGDASEAGVRYALVPASGPATSPRQVNQYELGRQSAPAAARIAGGFLVAWADESGTMTLPGESRLRRRSFDSTGRALTDESALSPDGTSAREVSLASDGAAVVAVWTRDALVPFDRPVVVGQRLTGPSVDASPFVVSDVDGAQPTAAFLATGDIAVAWVGRSDDPRGDVRARLVRSTGDPLAGTAATPLTWTMAPTGNVAEVAPRVLPLSGGDYLVTYEDGGVRRGVSVAEVGSAPLAAEYPALLSYLTAGLQGDVTLLSTARGLWFAWSDTSGFGEPSAHRSFLAYLLAPS